MFFDERSSARCGELMQRVRMTHLSSQINCPFNFYDVQHYLDVLSPDLDRQAVITWILIGLTQRKK